VRFTKFFADFIKKFGKAHFSRPGAIPTIMVGTAQKGERKKGGKREISKKC
jgi:hypothetical protein